MDYTKPFKFLKNLPPKLNSFYNKRSSSGVKVSNKSKTKKDGTDIFDIAIKNASPLLEVKTRRIGGANYQVPIEVPKNRQFFLASKWIISSAKGRSGKSMSERLATEFISAANNEGGAIKKKEDVHRMAEANRAFAHFR